MLAAMIYMGGHISGGHFNPAVSLSMFLEGALSFNLLISYMVAQVVGVFAAAGLFNVLTEATFFPAPAQQVAMWEAALIEALLTFVFCAVILVISRKRIPGGDLSIAGLVIGLVLTGLIFTGGDISGGCFNPAVGVGSIVFDIMRGGEESLKLLPIYLVGPLAGAVGASFFQQFLNGSKN